MTLTRKDACFIKHGQYYIHLFALCDKFCLHLVCKWTYKCSHGGLSNGEIIPQGRRCWSGAKRGQSPIQPRSITNISLIILPPGSRNRIRKDQQLSLIFFRPCIGGNYPGCGPRSARQRKCESSSSSAPPDRT